MGAVAVEPMRARALTCRMVVSRPQIGSSRRECPVCKTTLTTSSSMRADSESCMGLRKLGATWPAEPVAEDEVSE